MTYWARSFQRASVLGVVLSFLCIAGCAPAPNKSLDPLFWGNVAPAPVVVATEQAPKAELDRKGPQAAAGLVGSRLTSFRFAYYLHNYKVSGLGAEQMAFINLLQQHRIPAQKYNTSLPKGSTDYPSLIPGPENRCLLVLKIKKLGAERKYISAIPTGAPVAFCIAEGKLIQLADNTLLWHFTSKQSVDVQGEWDQPPQYIPFTNALNRAVNKSMDALLQNFSAQAPR